MWNDLKLEIDICTKCILEKTRINPIVGEGNKKAEILFVLVAQIALINPKYIVTVGERATKSLLEDVEKEDIKDLVGKVFDFYGEIKVVPIYDISYLFKATDKEKWKLIKILEKL